MLEKSFDEYLIIYFFSLVAIAEAVAAPPNIGSEIERGRGLVFSMYGNNGNNIKKWKK